MRTTLITLLLSVFVIGSTWAQDRTTIEAASADISDNLDLEAVASLFAEVEDLEEFEERLNDPDSRYSNLDLNQDGYVDYLRVLEKSKGNSHLIQIQAVIGKDVYQDVATIDVEKDNNGKTRVQVIGDVYMYGPDYIIEPVFVRPPIIFSWFWGPRWTVWYSPWYWGYYPRYWRRWAPYPYYVYHTHVYGLYHHHNHVFHYVPYRRSAVCKSLSQQVSRNDLAKKKPEMAFAARNKEVRNKYELDNKRGTQSLAKPRPAPDTKTTGKEIKTDWKPRSERDVPIEKRDSKDVKPDTRTTRPDPQSPRTEEAKPRSPKTDSRESGRDYKKPRTEDVPRSSTKPSARESKPSVKPSKPSKPNKPRKDVNRSRSKSSSSTRPSKPSSKPKTSSPKKSDSSKNSSSRGDR
ncbi:MAG: hypothetical protein HKN45_12560 [Flavobacteriales bacterium]|nr:hypothetical protein [Flavobacteriales bacterium]